MKLASFVQLDGKPRLGAVIEQGGGARICDLAAASYHFRATQAAGGFVLPSDMVRFLETGEHGLVLARKVLDWAADTGTAIAPLEAVRLVAPVPRPPKLLALAGNYQEHIVEGGGTAVDKSKVVPMLFMKPSTTLSGQGEPLVLPGGVSRTVDWELEIAVVIGRRAKYVPAETALEYVAGVCCVLDQTAEDILAENPRFLTRAKNFPIFFAFGPHLVTTDEVLARFGSLADIVVGTYRNGTLQRSNSVANMLYSPQMLISFHSKVMPLLPGDVISTGTPGAVVISDGDVAECRIAGIGSLVNPVVGAAGIN